MDSFLNATLGSFLTPRLEMRLFDRVDKFTAESATIGNVMTYFHEHVHYFQTLFTGYGHIQWSSYRQASGFTSRKWVELCKVMGEYRIPLANCNTREDVRSYANYLQRVFAEQNEISRARYINIPGAKTTSDLNLLLIKHSWQINPLIDTPTGKQEICTKHILEGHAFFLERSFGDQFLGVPEDLAWSRTGISNIYTAAYDWFISRCGETARDFFPALCDLALQTSWDPLIPSNFEEWQASNPSWRFYLLTEALAEGGYLALTNSGTWEDNYLLLSKTLLQACHFKSLNQVLDERLQSLIKLEKSPGLSPWQLTMKRAIEDKIDQPWLSAYPTNSPAEVQKLFDDFRIPAVLIEGRYQSQSSLDDVVATELIAELHFQAFVEQLLGYPTPISRDDNQIECGFSKFQIHNGCPFQVSGECTGRFHPQNGLPIPLSADEKGNINGCTFGAYFNFAKIPVTELQVDYSAKHID